MFYKEYCTTSQKSVFKGSELDLTKSFLSDRQGRTLEEAVYQLELQFIQWFLESMIRQSVGFGFYIYKCIYIITSETKKIN